MMAFAEEYTHCFMWLECWQESASFGFKMFHVGDISKWKVVNVLVILHQSHIHYRLLLWQVKSLLTKVAIPKSNKDLALYR